MLVVSMGTQDMHPRRTKGAKASRPSKASANTYGAPNKPPPPGVDHSRQVGILNGAAYPPAHPSNFGTGQGTTAAAFPQYSQPFHFGAVSGVPGGIGASGAYPQTSQALPFGAQQATFPQQVQPVDVGGLVPAGGGGFPGGGDASGGGWMAQAGALNGTEGILYFNTGLQVHPAG